MPIDLTPFNFTPTENTAYEALLSMGPSTGYALAKELSIARANAYQALNGLVAKGAAVATGERPTRYRATRPDVVFATLIDRINQKLDVLQAQIARAPAAPQESLVSLTGRRALVDLAMRTAVKEHGRVEVLGPGNLLLDMAPAWRRRATDDRVTSIWLLGEGTDFPFVHEGIVPLDLVETHFNTEVLILTTSTDGIASRLSASTANGYWTTDLTLLGLLRTTLKHFTS